MSRSTTRTYARMITPTVPRTSTITGRRRLREHYEDDHVNDHEHAYEDDDQDDCETTIAKTSTSPAAESTQFLPVHS